MVTSDLASSRSGSAGSKKEDDVSLHNGNAIQHKVDHEKQEQRVSDMTTNDDIEAYPDAANVEQDKEYGTAVSRVLSRMSTKSSWKDPGPPPDGQLSGWTQVFIGHLVIMSTWGFINSFGVFQNYYVTFLDRPPSDVAWIGSIQVFLVFFIGTFTGRLTDAGFFREVFLLGTFLSVLAVFMASISTQYWQIFLSQGLCAGLGNGCLFCPMLSLVSTYFSTKKNLAIGITACGSATGGLVFCVMVQQLLPSVGFGWTMRALGFTQLGCLVVANIFAKQRLPPRRAGPIVEWAAFREMPYTLFAVGMFFVFWGVYFPFFYVGAYARTIVGLSYTQSINLLIVLNGVGYVGRLPFNYIADRTTGPLNVMIPACLSTSIIVYCMLAVNGETGLYIWAITFGILGAAIQSLFPATLSSLTTDLRKAGVRMGMTFTIVSFGVLTGPPIQGALITAAGGRYIYAQVFSATCLLVGVSLLTCARLQKTGRVWLVKT